MIKYFHGAFFLIIASIISVANDTVTKYVACNTQDVVFLRSLFSSIILLPLVLYYRPKLTLISARNHVIRALIFGSSLMMFVYALKKLPLALTTSINFSIPVWVVILARIFLKEQLKERLTAVVISLIGICITCIPIWQNGNIKMALLLIISTIGFASLDVFNKYLINKEESIIMMLFGSSFFISLFSLPFFSFTIPESTTPFVWLGIGGNLMLFFLLKAWSVCDISALQPIKFIDFPIALYVGAQVFNDVSHAWMFVGVAILIFGIILNILKEAKANKAKN